MVVEGGAHWETVPLTGLVVYFLQPTGLCVDEDNLVVYSASKMFILFFFVTRDQDSEFYFTYLFS